MRIAFQYEQVPNYIAGVTVLEQFFAALRSLGPESPEIILLTQEENEQYVPSEFNPYVNEIIHLSCCGMNRGLIQRVKGRVGRMVRGYASVKEQSLDTVLRQRDVDCLVSYAWTRNRLISVPRLGWILDFQYKHLPEMFGPGQDQYIEGLFRQEVERADVVMVNCRQESQDLCELCPRQAERVRVVRWVATVPASIYEADPAEVSRRYHLPEKFFYLPNQFWKHKNHLVVLDALRILKSRGIRPMVVCSGSLTDGRFPSHFMHLLQRVSEWNIRDQVVILGVVPRSDVYQLMRQCACLINPSRFEGIGLSVTEGTSLGKRMLLSDLAVFREHEAPGCLYFDTMNAEDVADKIAEVWAESVPGPDRVMEAAAREALPRRLRGFGESLVRVCAEAVSLHHGRSPHAVF